MGWEHIVGAGGIWVVLLATPESTRTGTIRVIVGRGRSKTLLTLVVTSVEDLKENGNQEEEAGECQRVNTN